MAEFYLSEEFIKSNKIISVVGPHANESLDQIFQRKINDIDITGFSFWVAGSSSANPRIVQNFCFLNKPSYIVFINPGQINGATNTKISAVNHFFSEDKINWNPISDKISNVTGKSYAFILNTLDIIQDKNLIIDLNYYAKFPDNIDPIKINIWQSTFCTIYNENMKNHPNRMKSNIRKIIAIGKLKEPYSVWVK
jgi:hypothetical protein